MRLKNSGMYKMSETLFILVLDSQYNYYLNNKPEMVNAYWDFLTEKFYANSVKDIVLAGQSRGGCLSTLLAKRLRETEAYKDIPIVLQLNDAVCRTNGSEIPGISPGTKKFALNPLHPEKFKSIKLDLAKVFPVNSRSNLFINNIHAGGNVVPRVIGNIRSFTFKSHNTDMGWWRQHWVNYSHTDMGGNFSNVFDTVQPAFDHIVSSLKKIRYNKKISAAPAPVDVNGDGLSDIITFEKAVQWRNGAYAVSGLNMTTHLSKANGKYNKSVQNILAENINLSFHPITPFLAGYFSNDRKTDVVNLIHNPQSGLTIRTYVSNGDGTYTAKFYASGDGIGYRKYPALVGDVNGDGLSDIMIFYRDVKKGLMIRTKFSNGNGQFRNVEFQLGDGSSVDDLPFFAGDINRDGKTDLIMQYQDNHGHKIRTKISNGDGTFTGHEASTGDWMSWEHEQFLVADVNKDRRSDLIRVFFDKSRRLNINSYLARNDGSYDVKRQILGDSEGYAFPAVVADINGDGRDDIILRSRNSNNKMIINAKLSNGDGTYRASSSTFSNNTDWDATPALIGTFDKDRRMDLAFHSVIRQEDNTIRSHESFWTLKGYANGKMRWTGRADVSNWIAGFGREAFPALSGPIFWQGHGGTFPPCRPPLCAMTLKDEGAVLAPLKNIPLNPVPKPNSGLIPAHKKKAIKKAILLPRPAGPIPKSKSLKSSQPVKPKK